MSTDGQADIPRALTIAGSDSGGGAGIQADLKTFAAMGVYGASAITAVTAQNTLEVRDWLAMPADLVAQQIDAVLSDIGADAVKTGMLPNAAVIRTVAEKLRQHGVTNLVVDPVMIAKGGHALIDDTATEAMIEHLAPLASVITPNLPEAEAIAGVTIGSWDDAKEAARRIVAMGARSVVVKGGHFENEPTSTDLYYDGHAFREYNAIRVRSKNTHGTGCTFASGIAAGLARGATMTEAIATAKSFVTLAIQHSFSIGHGHGPVHHFYRYYQPVGPKYRPGVSIARKAE